MMTIILICILLGISSCFGQNTIEVNSQPIQLTPDQKRTDFKFFFDFVRENYPFVESIEYYKKLPNFLSFETEYINRASETKDNKEFIELFAELIQMLRQGTCHANILEGIDLPTDFDTAKHAFYNNISIESFKLNKYWWELLDFQSKFSNSDIKIKYNLGQYVVAEDYRVNTIYIPKGCVIVKIDGLYIHDYVKALHNKILLRLDDSLHIPYSFQPSPFTTFGDISKADWHVEFKDKYGESLTCSIPKKQGFRDAKVYPNLMENVICRELTNEVAYIRLFRFPSVSEASVDLRTIHLFFNKEHSFSKLIIDIRNNNGGSKTYGEELLFKPFLRDTIIMNEYAAVKKNIYNTLNTKRKTISEMEGNSFDIELGYGEIKIIDYERLPEKIKQKNSNDTSCYYFNSKTTYIPENKVNFEGDIILLVDNDCVSACDNLARTFQMTNTARILGTNTQGGTTVVLPTWNFELPNSHILFRLEIELAFNRDGSVNEIIGTIPDKNLEPSSYPTSFPISFDTEDLIKDEWIKWVIENE